jgi:hypothetical protein
LASFLYFRLLDSPAVLEIPKIGKKNSFDGIKVAGYSSSLIDLDVLIAAPPSLRADKLGKSVD